MSSDWKFDKEVAPIFDGHVREHVPMYEEIHRFITNMSAWFTDSETSFYDIGTSTGQVIANIKNAYPRKFSRYVGIDMSEDMCEIANKRFLSEDDVEIVHGDVLSETFEMKNANIITSVLTLMFIPINKRQGMVDKCYEALNSGGAFLLVEKVVGNSVKINEIWSELYHEIKLENGVSAEGVFKKSKAIRGVLKPLSVEENIEILKKSGFNEVDIFIKWGSFVGFIAIK